MHGFNKGAVALVNLKVKKKTHVIWQKIWCGSDREMTSIIDCEKEPTHWVEIRFEGVYLGSTQYSYRGSPLSKISLSTIPGIVRLI